MDYKTKIYNSITNLNRSLQEWREENYTLVFTNGVFDLLHIGHVQYLQDAKDLGHKLIVAINSNNSVQKLKGKNRPINSIESRIALIASLACVDAVIEFDEDTPIELINKIQPNVLVKGSDYKLEDIVGRTEVLAKGGIVKRIEFVEGYSSSAIIEKIKEL